MVDAIDPGLRIRSARLAVADLERSAAFYEHVLGLPLVGRDGERAQLGPNPSEPALELVQLESPRAAPPGSAGLFHIAWLHPSRAGLAETVRRVAGSGWQFTGASDHGVSEALYLDDPDGLGIEIYVDRPRERWARPEGGSGVVMVTEPLDLEDLLATFPGPYGPAVEAGTGIGHVHLKVSDVARALGFYERLGFERQAAWPSAAFVAAGGYHHHLGLNSWQSARGPAPSSDAPGLREVAFELSGAGPLQELAARAGADGAPGGEGAAPGSAGEQLAVFDREGGRLAMLDPDGEQLLFSAAQAA